MQFILERQARFTSNLEKLEIVFQRQEAARKRDSARVKRLEDSFQLLVRLAESHDERLVDLGDGLINLAEAQIRVSEQIAATNEQIAAMNERTAETDERLNALIAVVERYISRGQNNSPQG